jgi:hypothetical protein
VSGAERPSGPEINEPLEAMPPCERQHDLAEIRLSQHGESLKEMINHRGNERPIPIDERPCDRHPIVARSGGKGCVGVAQSPRLANLPHVTDL